MTATPAQALTEIAMLLTDNFAGPVSLPNMDFTEPADMDTVWARLTLEHTVMAQSTLANVNNMRRYTNEGIGTVRLFFPLGKGIKAPYEQADTVAGYYRGKRTVSDIWFRNVTITHPQDIRSKHYVLDVIFDFLYDQIS